MRWNWRRFFPADATWLDGSGTTPEQEQKNRAMQLALLRRLTVHPGIDRLHLLFIYATFCCFQYLYSNKKAVLSQGNRTMPQLFFLA